MIRVSVIIVNYNTCDMTKKCIDSIRRYTKNMEYEIIVVDNGSTDMSRATFEADSSIRYLYLKMNVGFGQANNVGAKEALGKYLFFLNSDTLLTSNAIYSFYQYIEAHSEDRIAVLGGRLISADGKENISYGIFPGIKSELMYIAYRLMRKRYGICHQDNRAMRVDFVCGADMFMPRSLFLELNGFDKGFFMYYEETDIQKRMADMGYSRVILPYIDIIHLDGGSFGDKGLTYNRYCMSQRSYNYYMSRHKRTPYILANKAVLSILRCYLFTMSWSIKERIKGYMLLFG